MNESETRTELIDGRIQACRSDGLPKRIKVDQVSATFINSQ